MRKSRIVPPGVRYGSRGYAAEAARGAATCGASAAVGATGEKAATTMRAAADSIAMVTRMVDTRAIRETDTRAGGRIAAVAAGTAEERTVVMTAGETPSRGCCFASLHPDASYLVRCIFFKKKIL
jgi:hypothetical protein